MGPACGDCARAAVAVAYRRRACVISNRPISRGWIVPPSASKALREKCSNKQRVQSRRASALSISSLTAKSLSALIDSWAERVPIEQGLEMVVRMPGRSLLKTSTHIGVLCIDGLHEQILEAHLLNTSPRPSKTWPFSAELLDFKLLQETVIDLAFSRLFSNQVPKMADLRLANAVDATKSSCRAGWDSRAGHS